MNQIMGLLESAGLEQSIPGTHVDLNARICKYHSTYFMTYFTF